MEKGQAVSVVKRLAAYYPNWKVDKGTVDIWVTTLTHEDYENVNQNVQDYIRSNEYPPSIAAIIKQNDRVTAEREKERTRQMLREMEEQRRSIPKDPPWVREGISKEEWMRRVVERERKAQ